jgi:ribonuclease P protein component
VHLRRRPEFVAARHGVRWSSDAFSMQAVSRPSNAGTESIGIGFTTTKRLGGAVVRNRIRRRLREASRQVLPNGAAAGVNYVLIARPAALTCAFTKLTSDLERAFTATTRRLAGRALPPGRANVS